MWISHVGLVGMGLKLSLGMEIKLGHKLLPWGVAELVIDGWELEERY